MIEALVLKVKRAETPFYRRLRDAGRAVRSSMLPVPRFADPLLRAGFQFQQTGIAAFQFLISYFVRGPLFRGRCSSIGKRFHAHRMPFVIGHARIHIGDDVVFFGQVDVISGRIFDAPQLVIKDRVEISHNVLFVVNREIVVEEDVNISNGVRIMDTDSHPRDPQARMADLPPSPEEIKPVRICRGAWIGQNVFILKGVTVGAGAIIGVNSVVVTDIPPYTVAMGNPARVVIKNAAPKAAESH